MNRYRWMKAAAVVVCAVVLSGGEAGCRSCRNVDCGSGLAVRWQTTAAINNAALVRLCIDNACDEPQSPRGSIAPDSAPGLGELNVRLEILDRSGKVLRTIEGSGRRSGGCCPLLTMEPSDDGSALVAAT
jgi:hypothetical protein